MQVGQVSDAHPTKKELLEFHTIVPLSVSGKTDYIDKRHWGKKAPTPLALKLGAISHSSSVYLTVWFVPGSGMFGRCLRTCPIDAPCNYDDGGFVRGSSHTGDGLGTP